MKSNPLSNIIKRAWTRPIVIAISMVFSAIGLVFTIVFIAMQLDLFRVTGSVLDRNESLNIAQSKALRPRQYLCIINAIDSVAPDTSRALASAYSSQNIPRELLQRMLTTTNAQLDNNAEFKNKHEKCLSSKSLSESSLPNKRTAFAWANSDEWATLSSALRRDQAIIHQASRDSGIPTRIIITGIIGEQFRFFSGTRTAFKNYFEPLKIFGRLSKFSYGIAGLKPDTVRTIEKNLQAKGSVFYLGPKYEQFARYSRSELQHDDPQLQRITNPDNNYYSYLYVGLYMNQVIHQWKAAGYDISEEPGVLATLYNLGFNRSVPKANPLPGGAPITVNNTRYTFGQIGEEFYYSGELMDEFPYE